MVVTPTAEGGGMGNFIEMMKLAEGNVFRHSADIFEVTSTGVKHEDGGQDDVRRGVASRTPVMDGGIQYLFQFQFFFQASQEDGSSMCCDFFLASFHFFLYSHFGHLLG